MNDVLPPLKSLLSFEAVANQCSFTKAAKTLNLTHSAVSQSIKILEKYLSHPLFDRSTHSVKLTKAGEMYFNEISKSLNMIRNASRQLLTNEHSLTVNMQTSFAVRWFNSRLEEFMNQNPSIDFRVSTLRLKKTNYSDFDNYKIDLAIDYGSNDDWPNCIVEKLLDDSLILAASPKIFKFKKNNFKEIINQNNCIFVSQISRKNDYKLWCNAHRLDEPDPSSHIYYTSTTQGLNAAVQGLGIMVTHKLYIEDALTNGSLIKIPNSDVEIEKSYFLVHPENSKNAFAVNIFKQWIRSIL
ncbi:MAG TPA: LysR family transcriptional regulator [Victivallales bacterium]|nr:LysR family transcriptional regulator [Victivallales bacterium]